MVNMTATIESPARPTAFSRSSSMPDFGDSSVNYVLRFWIHDPQQGLTNVRGRVMLALWDSFKANGVKIPFPQREITIRQDQSAERDLR